MTTVQQIYEEMQRIAPLALAESWDNPGLLVDCGGGVSRVLVTLDITPEVVEEAARKGCGLNVEKRAARALRAWAGTTARRGVMGPEGA